MRSSTLCRCLLLLLARPTGIIGPAEEPYLGSKVSRNFCLQRIRIALVVIEAFIGLGAIGGGIAILTGAYDQWLPITWLRCKGWPSPKSYCNSAGSKSKYALAYSSGCDMCIPF